MSGSTGTRPENVRHRESAPFWSGLEQGLLQVQYCLDCGQPFFYPRVLCPVCRGSRLEWRSIERSGSVYSYTVVHPRDPSEPYTVLLVELAAHARVLMRLDPMAEGRVAIGEQVDIRIADVDGSTWLTARPRRCGSGHDGGQS